MSVPDLVTRVAGPGPVRGDLIAGDVHARRDPGSVLSALCPGGCPHQPRWSPSAAVPSRCR